jgi:hypothetical protein
MNQLIFEISSKYKIQCMLQECLLICLRLRTLDGYL